MPRAYRLRQYDLELATVRALHRAGVSMLAGTDVGSPYVYPGVSLHDELALFVQAGFSPGEVLKTATYNPAKFLGMLDSLSLWLRTV